MTDKELVERLLDFDKVTVGDARDAALRIEALTEQLEAARADAKEAEAYAGELERDLKTCRMAQVVMENGIAEAEKERDEALNQLDSARHSVDVLEKRVAFVEDERRKTFQALLKVTKIHDEVEAKLAKAVEALRAVDALDPEGMIDGCSHHALRGLVLRMGEISRATLAETEGEKT